MKISRRDDLRNGLRLRNETDMSKLKTKDIQKGEDVGRVLNPPDVKRHLRT